MQRIYLITGALAVFINLSTFFLEPAFAQFRLCDDYKNRHMLLEKRFAKYSQEQAEKLDEIDKKIEEISDKHRNETDNAKDKSPAELSQDRSRAYNALQEERTRIQEFYEDKKNSVRAQIQETKKFLDNCRRFQ